MRSYALDTIMGQNSNSNISSSSNSSNKTNSNNNNSDDFIASPKGTKPFPFVKKCRTIAKRNKTILITIPHEICHLLKIEQGDEFNVYCDIESSKIIVEKL